MGLVKNKRKSFFFFFDSLNERKKKKKNEKKIKKKKMQEKKSIENFKAPEHSIDNKSKLYKSKIVGCYQCCEIYSPQEIQDYVDNNQTALCSKCGIDSVLPDSIGFPITRQNLEILKAIYF